MHPFEWLRQQIAQAQDREFTPVLLRWVERTGGTRDPVTGTPSGATETWATETVAASVQVVKAQAVERKHAELVAGDLIVDFPPSIDLSQRASLELVLDDVVYTRKAIGTLDASFADAKVGGETGLVTLIFTRKT